MECRMFFTIVLFHVAHGSSFGKGRSPGFLTGKENSTVGQVAVNPQFLEEPDDKFILPNTPGSLTCEARFVSKLKFNCSGELVPREILNSEYIDNVTFLIAEISQSQIKNRTSVFLCNCVATGYNGQVIRSRAAVVQRAYLDEDFVISPSVDTRVQKNSLVTLRCKAPEGNPSPAVSWWKDGRPVDTHRNRRLLVKSHSNSSLVIIRKVKLSDGGDYSCVASNLLGRRESAIIKLNVYVDGGWSEWTEFRPCDAAKCENGTKMLKRYCTNPEPENGGQFCTGDYIKTVLCEDVCPDVEITCPNHIDVYLNRSVAASKNVSWEKPIVRNKKNDTKFSVQVFPQWAEPPVTLQPAERSVYVVKYVVKNEFGQTASCSFNITVYNDSSRACETRGCNVPVTEKPQGATPTEIKSGGPVLYLLMGLTILLMTLSVLAGLVLLHRRRMSQKYAATKHYEGTCSTDLELNVVTRSASYVEPAENSGKLKEQSPIYSEVFDFPGPVAYSKEPTKTMQIEAEITEKEKTEKPRGYRRTNSSISNKSTVSEISRMMWNISNIPENADPKMVAMGLVDHNGGKFTIGNTGVILTVPPLAIPEGRTEGIYVAIMDQEKEHPQLTSKESLLSPVVKCGPTGLKFQCPVILSMPHCALLEEGAWNLKVQYNESEPSTAADWKPLIDVNKQDGSEPSHVVVESNMVHLMVDHFTYFALTGKSAANKQAPKDVQVLAYVTPPEVDGDCVVRVYCVGGTPAAIEDVHNQEIKKYRGETIEAPKQLRFKDGGGDLMVELKSLRPGWTSEEDANKINFQDIWEGIQRMPSCTFVFSLSDARVSQFRAKFKMWQDCEDGEERDVNVVTSVKQRPSEIPGPSQEATNHSTANLTCTCEHLASLPKAVSSPSLVDHSTALVNAGSLAKLWQSSQADVPGTCGGNAGASPVSLKQMSSGYFSVGFESLSTAHSLSRELRSKLSVFLDPPHEFDWKVLAEKIGLSYTDIKWIESRKAFSPTEILFNLWETRDKLRLQYPLQKMAEILQEMGRDDAVEVIQDKLHSRKETTV